MTHLKGGKYLIDLSYLLFEPSDIKTIDLSNEQVNTLLTKSIRMKLNLDSSLIEFDIIPNYVYWDGGFFFKLTDDSNYECNITFSVSDKQLEIGYTEL